MRAARLSTFLTDDLETARPRMDSTRAWVSTNDSVVSFAVSKTASTASVIAANASRSAGLMWIRCPRNRGGSRREENAKSFGHVRV
jgi:hypothetical protein